MLSDIAGLFLRSSTEIKFQKLKVLHVHELQQLNLSGMNGVTVSRAGFELSTCLGVQDGTTGHSIYCQCLKTPIRFERIFAFIWH